MEEANNKIYLVLSQTGTLPSRLIKLATKAEFNHASISMSRDLTKMYSFARRHPYNPFWAGFVTECPSEGTFARFPKTNAVVLEIEVEPETYNKIDAHLKRMLEEKDQYSYNYLGLVLAWVHKARKKARCYYCSEFVGELLTRYHIIESEALPEVIYPTNLLELPFKRIYKGRLLDFQLQAEK